MTFTEALKLRMADDDNKLFADDTYAKFIALAGGISSLAYDPSDSLHEKYLDLSEREVLLAILRNPDDPKFNTFKEGAYAKTLDISGIQGRIAEIAARYRRRTRMSSL